MKTFAHVLWPSFLIAGIAEAAFFTLIAPQELYLFGEAVHFSAVATYSIGFFSFWVVCAASSILTCFLQRSAGEVNHPPADTARTNSTCR